MAEQLEHMGSLGELRKQLASDHPTLVELKHGADADKLFRNSHDGKWYLIPIESFKGHRDMMKRELAKVRPWYAPCGFNRGKIPEGITTLDLTDKK